ncbi:hypothetical protein J27TS8_30070 [Robertmurraya siralis]|uniref:Group-specific protein n=1 Tax=Robertmurraya siralis TaxID=77777 RepID=A0A919WJW7_9BACI|nr:hypothetical protein [Robertmurraya siralis]PAE19596.1 hypothetical protein CHH80_15200 [Bacillus sp. 7504-2]GIN63014.1 hypothetical protein J27TS8_30070 [Robertmurraya siralis]
MFKEFSPGIKISITRSITTSFEKYMNDIGWNEEKFNIEKFVQEWKHYITGSSSWYDKISDEVKNDPAFHEQLAEKINETIDKILSEAPTKEQMAEIESLQKEWGEEFDYSCKTEAKYVIEKYKELLKKKQNN